MGIAEPSLVIMIVLSILSGATFLMVVSLGVMVFLELTWAQGLVSFCC